MRKNNSIVKKVIDDFKGVGKYVSVPHINQYSKTDVNICKFSGLVTVIKRRSDKQIAKEWSNKIFSNKFSKTKYTANIPAVIARQTYVFETLKKLTKLNNKFICDIGAGEGQFLDLVKKNFPNAKTFGVEPSKKNSIYLKKKGHKYFCGTIQEFRKLKKIKKKFDVVTIMWTLVNTSSCLEMVNIAHEIIKKNGIILVAESSRILVPFKKPLNLYFSPLKSDLHPFHFSKNSLKNLLIINKFNPIFVNRYIDTDYILVAAKKLNKIKFNKIEIDNYKKVVNFFKRWHKDTFFYKKNLFYKNLIS
tara:strand:+ start:633 stop:1544 length:912 start_codon:yes stop_codon:yes gene_type:complete